MLYVDEFGPLVAAWLRLPQGTVETFDAAYPWQVAAALRLGDYAAPESDTTPQTTRPNRVRSGAVGHHKISPRDLAAQRVAHARDPENNPEPRPPGPDGADMLLRSLNGG